VKQPFLLIIATVVLIGCKWEPNKSSSAPISQVIRDIAACNVLMGNAVGIAAQRPQQWDRYETLRSKATEQELLALANDTNCVVRCYAFQALAERKKTDLFPVVLQHLSDTATVHTLYGCLGGSQKVGDFFLETITKTGNNEKSWQLNRTQRSAIDSVLLFKPGNKLEAKDNLLYNIQPQEKYYAQIRKIAMEENNKMAVVALSKYRKQQDKPLIEQLLKDPNNQTCAFLSVREFPAPSFFPYLQQALKNEITKNNDGNDVRLQLLYQAIVQYKDQPSRSLLQFALDEAKGIQYIYHWDYLQQALIQYPSTIYDGLLKPITPGIRARKGGI